MRARVIVISAAAFVAAGFAAAPAASDEMKSLYSIIARKACRNPNPKPAEQIGDHEKAVYRCADFAGRAVTLTFYGTSIGLDLRRKGAAVAAKAVAPYDFGDRIEWRGALGAQGFAPHAAIVRMRVKTGAGKVGAALAVLKLENDAICPAALVDAGARDANLQARRAADESIGFICGRDKPRILGAETEAVKDIAAAGR